MKSAEHQSALSIGHKEAMSVAAKSCQRLTSADSHFASSASAIELCDFFHGNYYKPVLISKRVSCVSYLGTGFFKFFTFSALFLRSSFDREKLRL